VLRQKKKYDLTRIRSLNLQHRDNEQSGGNKRCSDGTMSGSTALGCWRLTGNRRSGERGCLRTAAVVRCGLGRFGVDVAFVAQRFQCCVGRTGFALGALVLVVREIL
jgi:hypothetical protein